MVDAEGSCAIVRENRLARSQPFDDRPIWNEGDFNSSRPSSWPPPGHFSIVRYWRGVASWCTSAAGEQRSSHGSSTRFVLVAWDVSAALLSRHHQKEKKLTIYKLNRQAARLNSRLLESPNEILIHSSPFYGQTVNFHSFILILSDSCFSLDQWHQSSNIETLATKLDYFLIFTSNPKENFHPSHSSRFFIHSFFSISNPKLLTYSKFHSFPGSS